MAIAEKFLAGIYQQNQLATKPGISSRELNRLSFGRNQEIKALVIIIAILSGGNVFSLRALGSVGNLHGNRLALLKRLVPLSQDRAVVDEYVFSTLLGYEPIALGIVKPLNCACHCFRHNFTL
jgi:hypothetical protein